MCHLTLKKSQVTWYKEGGGWGGWIKQTQNFHPPDEVHVHETETDLCNVSNLRFQRD